MTLHPTSRILGHQRLPLFGKRDAGATTGEFAPKKIYVFGGMAGFAEPLNNNFVYDAENDSWSRRRLFANGAIQFDGCGHPSICSMLWEGESAFLR